MRLAQQKLVNATAHQDGSVSIVIVHAATTPMVLSAVRLVPVKTEHLVTPRMVWFFLLICFFSDAGLLLIILKNLPHQFAFACLFCTYFIYAAFWLECRSRCCLGSCTCAAGYTGNLCEQKCSPGWFGQNCSQICQCEDGHSDGCDPITGNCFCKPEWKGILGENRFNILEFFKIYYDLVLFNFGYSCNFLIYVGVRCETHCPLGKYGPTCDQECNCKNNSSCDPDTGACVCSRGWQGDDCSKPCDPGYYGIGCKEVCPTVMRGRFF